MGAVVIATLDEVGRGRLEGDVATVDADCRPGAGAIGLLASDPGGDALESACQSDPDEGVRSLIAIFGNQAARHRIECDNRGVSADPRMGAASIGRRTIERPSNLDEVSCLEVEEIDICQAV